jgi:hypothetical protein
MSNFVAFLTPFLPALESQEQQLVENSLVGYLTAHNQDLAAKLGRGVSTPADIAAFARVVGQQLCAEEDVLIKGVAPAVSASAAK